MLISNDFSQWLHTERYGLQKELSSITDLEVWHSSGNIHSILKNIRFVPDFILIYLYGSINCPKISGLETLKLPFGVYVEDVHSLDKFNYHVTVNNIKHIFNCYRDAFIRVHPKLVNRMIWMPHHIDLNLFKDMNQPKSIPMLMMGATKKSIYPLRHDILTSLSNHPQFVYHPHPGYRNISNRENLFIRERYVQEVNKAKLFFTCDSIYKYPVKKYFEVLGCNTLLLASDSKELRDLGFIPGENFVAINQNDFLKKAKYYLYNKSERQRISTNGYNMVRNKHSTQIRAKELTIAIKRIIT
ncbi:glycosyltransferase [Bacillus sp. es.034]|uniref:glycosyltransferase n=1 Tax=Bacillus sp. es.034 TaxID=1761763 RepID=UPI002570D803|nr:glycosyltransferase [Bacillus sp. es.034]